MIKKFLLKNQKNISIVLVVLLLLLIAITCEQWIKQS